MNKNKDKILDKLRNTSIYEEFIKLNDIYNDLEKKQEIFCNTFDVHCQKWCGTCCEHFIPDIYQVEARYLALGLILEGKAEEARERIEKWKKDSGYCPLYDFDSDYHCTVYKYRPLICRLFGATASKDKEGRPCFRKCKYNMIGKDLSYEELDRQKEAVIHMSDYAMMMEEYSLGEKEKLLLPEALLKEIDKILYILDLLD